MRSNIEKWFHWLDYLISSLLAISFIWNLYCWFFTRNVYGAGTLKEMQFAVTRDLFFSILLLGIVVMVVPIEQIVLKSSKWNKRQRILVVSAVITVLAWKLLLLMAIL